MKQNMAKRNFGATINELSGHHPVGASDCFNYGIVDGCDGYCPQLVRGECEGDVIETLKLMKDEGHENYEEIKQNGYYKEFFKELED